MGRCHDGDDDAGDSDDEGDDDDDGEDKDDNSDNDNESGDNNDDYYDDDNDKMMTRTMMTMTSGLTGNGCWHHIHKMDKLRSYLYFILNLMEKKTFVCLSMYIYFFYIHNKLNNHLSFSH